MYDNPTTTLQQVAALLIFTNVAGAALVLNMVTRHSLCYGVVDQHKSYSKYAATSLSYIYMTVVLRKCTVIMTDRIAAADGTYYWLQPALFIQII